jgi:hypothetical protein
LLAYNAITSFAISGNFCANQADITIPYYVQHRIFNDHAGKIPANSSVEAMLEDQFYAKYMNFADVASIAGAVSALAVLVSLLFLNIQLRLTQKNQRALTQQGRAGRTADIAMRLMAADFAVIFCRCKNGDPSISEAMLDQFMGYCRAVFLGAEDSFIQHEEELLSELAFVSFSLSLHEIFVSPGVRAVWKMTREWYGPEFVDFMDAIAKQSSTRPAVDQLAQWKTVVAG